jgi:hypothetical protein
MPIKSINELKSRRFILASEAQRHLRASNQQTGRGAAMSGSKYEILRASRCIPLRLKFRHSSKRSHFGFAPTHKVAALQPAARGSPTVSAVTGG